MYARRYWAFFAALSVAATTLQPSWAATFDAGAPWPAHITKGMVELPDGTLLATRVGPRDGQTIAFAVASEDGGHNWQEIGEFDRSPRPDADMGDPHLLVDPGDDGSCEVFCSYRFNVPRADGVPTYSIRCASSKDGGRTWSKPSIVAEAAGGGHGLWASFLHRTSKGSIQCYYDDEDSPNNQGFRGHQWITMKTLNRKTRRWADPVTVSRTSTPNELARDGMCSICEITDTRYLCVFESVSTSRRTPEGSRPAAIRMVESKNAGRAWNWREGRPIVHEPAGLFMAFSPWTVRLESGNILCVFATDEDRSVASKPGVGVGNTSMDIKSVTYDAKSRFWSKPNVVHAEQHKDYMPVIIPLRHGDAAGQYLLQFLDFSPTPRHFKLMRGKISESAEPADGHWGLWPKTPGKWLHQSGTQPPLAIDCLGDGSVTTEKNHAGVTWRWDKKPSERDPMEKPGRLSIFWPSHSETDRKFWRDEIIIDRGAASYSGRNSLDVRCKGWRPE